MPISNIAMFVSIFFITGTSGAGKTTLIQELKQILSEKKFAIYDFDENGVPENADQQWRINTTLLWLQKAEHNFKHNKITIILGVSVPSEIIALIKEHTMNLHPYFGFIKIDKATIKERLSQRNWSEKLISDNINWAHYLENEVKNHHDSIILDGQQSPHILAHRCIEWIKNHI